MGNHVVRGEPYRVGDIVRIKTDSAEVNKMDKKMTLRYSGTYEVIEVLEESWSFHSQLLDGMAGIKI